MQINETEQTGDDYCGKGHACHINATCLNLNTKYSCTCRPGFQGNGFDCTGQLTISSKFIGCCIFCINFQFPFQILTSAHNKVVNSAIIVIWTRCVRTRWAHMYAIVCLGFVVSINSIVPRSTNALPIYIPAMKVRNASIRSDRIRADAKMAMKAMAYNVNVSVLFAFVCCAFWSDHCVYSENSFFSSGVQANVFEWWRLHVTRHMYLPYGLYWCLLWTRFGRVCNWFARMQIVCVLC